MSTALVDAAEVDIDMTIRRTVRALRGAHESDARVMAAHLGISRQSLYNRLNGAAPFLAAEIARLAQFFGVPITDFYEGVVRIDANPGSLDTEVGIERYPEPRDALAPVIPLVSAASAGYPRVHDGYGSSGPAITYAEGPAAGRSAGTVNNANAA